MKSVQKRLLTRAVALLMLFAMVCQVMGQIEWPTRITRFERYDPVYDEYVEVGTELEDLDLPDTLRAIISLSELDLDRDTFVQAEPEVDTSDGYTHYDYYYYGYVIPSDAEEKYENGELVIYTITYAAQDGSDTVGEVGYRVYGSINGSNNVWFECDEDGYITSVILDIEVTWSGDYDPNTPGEYIFTAYFSDYSYSGSNPTALIGVYSDSDTDTVDASGNDVEAVVLSVPDNDVEAVSEETESSEETTETAEAEETAETEESEDTTVDASENDTEALPSVLSAVTEETDETDETDADTSDETDETGEDAEDETEETDCICALGENSYSQIHSEDCYWYETECTCDLQSNEYSYDHDEDCVWYVEPAEGCTCGEDGGPIDADNYLYSHNEDCPWYSPMECNCREQIEYTYEEEQEDGTTVTVTDVMDGDFTHVHDVTNTMCDLYGYDTVDIIKLDENSRSAQFYGGTASVMRIEDAEEIVAYQEEYGEAMYEALGMISIVEGTEQYAATTAVTLTTGTVETQMDSHMSSSAPTSGNSAYSSTYAGGTIPGTWVDYVNTIWQNKRTSFSWASTSLTKWTGGSSSINTSGTTYTVANASQLYYAMTHLKNNVTINITANIDMNGANYSWTPVDLSSYSGITINGNGYTIYNLGIYNTSTSTSVRTAFVYGARYGLTVTNLTFANAMIVSNNGGATSGTGLFYNQNGATSRYTVTFTSVTVKDSLIFSDNDEGVVSPFGRITANGSATSIGMVATVTRCASTGNYVYGVDHLSGFAHGLGTRYYTYGSNYSTSNWGRVTYTYVVDNILCGTGGHSAAFSSCNGEGFTLQYCFSSVELYGSAAVAGFVGGPLATVTDCFATGKLEGYSALGGFTFSYGAPSTDQRGVRSFTRCYTTVLVGLRSNPSEQGGFVARLTNNTRVGQTFTDCYAAGDEVVVQQITIVLTKNGDEKGSVTVKGPIEEGTVITIPTTYSYYYTSGGSEYIGSTTVNVTYTVEKDSSGAYYLRFNKIAGSTASTGDSTVSVSDANIVIDDLQFDTEITLVVTGGAISGLAWVDADGDGVRETASGGDDEYVESTGSNAATVGGVEIPASAEELFELDGLVATLMTKSGSTWVAVTDDSGDNIEVTLSKDGSSSTSTHKLTINGIEYTITTQARADYGYYFGGIDEGTYAVRFATSDFALGVYEPTTKDASEATDATDSDASGVYVNTSGATTTSQTDGYWLSYTIVEDITISSSSNGTGADAYISLNNDSGFVTRLGSVSVTKTDTSGETLSDVVFELQVLMSSVDDYATDPDSATWKTVDSETTDSSGKLSFTGLYQGIYRLVETETQSGYSLLADAIYITIPYSNDTTTGTTAAVSYAWDNSYYWLDVSYEIANGQIIAMPASGQTHGTTWYVITGSSLAAFSALAVINLVRSRSAKKRMRRLQELRDSLGC